jgi:hypothetical protein
MRKFLQTSDDGESPLKKLALALLALTIPAASWAADRPPAPAGNQVEWVYRIKPGFIDEWWTIFRTYDVPVLDEQARRGDVLRYEIQQPEMHSSEDVRWDYRVIVTYRDRDGPSREDAVARALFPDSVVRKRAENRRWELTVNHWDLPFHIVDPHASE